MYKKLAIFPVDYNSVAFVRNSQIGGYEAVPLLVPALKVLTGNDLSKLDGGLNANIQLYSDYKNKISECEIIYFTNSDLIQEESIYHELIEYAEKLCKEIVLTETIKERLGLDLKKEYSEQFFSTYNSKSSKLLQIDVPIISIFTLGYNCGQLQTELSMRKFFLDREYKVMQIGSQENFNLFGFLNTPTFLYDSALDVQQKILMFNKYVHDNCLLEDPDIIIIGVPEPIMKYNDNILNGFGVIPFIIENAIKSDIGVISLYYNQYTCEYFDLISQFTKYRFDILTKYFSVSNTQVTKNIDDTSLLEYLYIDIDFVKSNLDMTIGENKYTVFSPYDEESMTEAFCEIENELLSNLSQI